MSWSGVKNQVNKSDIESWCEEMRIKNYTINSQGEIDVDECVNLDGRCIKELPHKFGTIIGYFSVNNCDLISLKNCPNVVYDFFDCNNNKDLDSLKGCPKEIRGNIHCVHCQREFTKKEISSLSKVGGFIINLL